MLRFGAEFSQKISSKTAFKVSKSVLLSSWELRSVSDDNGCTRAELNALPLPGTLLLLFCENVRHHLDCHFCRITCAHTVGGDVTKEEGIMAIDSWPSYEWHSLGLNKERNCCNLGTV